MKNEQILEKALEKAVKNGWEPESGLGIYPMYREGFVPVAIEEVIFSHDFAKAFWGEEVEKHNGQELWLNNKKTYKWQYHQHQMLDEIQEGRNPIKYLEQFL